MDALFERFAVAKTKRIEIFGKRLEAILAELDKRDLSNLKTEILLKFALDYADRLKGEEEPLTLQGDTLAYDVSDLGLRGTWPA